MKTLAGLPASRVLIFIFLFIFCVKQAQCYAEIGNKRLDLESDVASVFHADAAFWTGSVSDPYAPSTPLTGTLYDTCGSKIFMGLKNSFTSAIQFHRKYKDLPPHDIIYYSMQLSLLDGWYYDSSAIVLFDHQDYGVGVFLMDSAAHFLTSTCGDPFGQDLPEVHLYGKAEHTGKTLTLTVLGNSHSFADKFLGFRDISLIFRNKTVAEEDEDDPRQFCGLAAGAALRNSNCKCGVGFFNEPYGVDGACEPCDPLCKTCLGELPSQCMTCADDAFYDGEECQICHPSCKTCYGPEDYNCLTCESTEYFLTGTGGACTTTCAHPLIDHGSNQCEFPCPAGKYLYTNSSCLDSCSFVFDDFEAKGGKFCYDYCPLGQYYVPPASSSFSGICVNSACPIGHFQDDDPRYCHPCQDPLCSDCPNFGATCVDCLTGAILNSDGVCKQCQTMLTSYIKATSSGHQYEMILGPSSCDLTAQAVQQHLAGTTLAIQSYPPFTFQVTKKGNNVYTVNLDLQGSVLNSGVMSVTLEHLSGTLSVPKTLVPSQTLEDIAEAIPAVGGVVTGVVGGSLVGTLALGATASLWSIINFQQFVGYFIYMNIEFPFQLNMFFDLLSSSSFSFLPNPIDWVTESIAAGVMSDTSEEYRPPQKFAEQDVTSFFIENAGGVLFMNLLLLLFLVIVQYIRSKSRFKKNWILKKIHQTLKWNFIFRSFLENGVPLILAIFLQFRVMVFRKVYVILSALAAVFSLVYFIIMFYYIVKALYVRDSEQLKKESVEEKIGTLYEGIDLVEPESKYYAILILARGTLLAFLLSYFQAIPVLQITPLIAFNAGIVYYLFKGCGFEDRNLNMINRIKEILIMFAEVFILCLNFQSSTEEYYNVMGWFTVVCFLTALLIELVYMIYIQIKGFATIKQKIMNIWNMFMRWYNQWKARRRRNKRKVKRILPESLELQLRTSGGLFDVGTAEPKLMDSHTISTLKDQTIIIEPRRKKQIMHL